LEANALRDLVDYLAMSEADEVATPSAYPHDSTQVSAFKRLVDQACDDVTYIHEIGEQIRQLATTIAPGITQPDIGNLISTFDYMLHPSALGVSRPGAELTPLDDERSLYPVPLKRADEHVHTLWRDLCAVVTHPVALARCHAIMFTLRLPGDNTRRHAEAAAHAYLACVGGSLGPRDQSHGLLRALTIARSMRLTDLEASITAVILDKVEEVITTRTDPRAGVLLLDAILAPQRKKGAPAAPDDRAVRLLDQVVTAYPHSRLLDQIATVVRARLGKDPARVDRANRALVEALLAEADNATEGALIRVRLNKAASQARQHGLHDLERLATTRLQAAPPVEWSTITTEPIELPAWGMNSFMRPYQHATTWQDALQTWLKTDSPAGSYKTNKAQADELFTISALSRAMTRVTFGHDDLPKRVATNDDDALDAELVRTESMNMSIYGLMLGNALDLIAGRFGIPNQEDLIDFMAEYSICGPWAKSLATALRLYWTHEYTACAHLAAPKVEAAARALLLELNEPVFRSSVGDKIGQFGGLGGLLDPLVDNGFDQDWARFLSTLLLSDGYNIRNDIAHGFKDDVDRNTAALVIRAAAVLITITFDDTAQRDRDAVLSALAHPIGPPRRRTWGQRVRRAAFAAYRELRR
jgi:hypothetical protein